ncbi:MAG TPA: FAD-binding oxidoreductase [Acetobacteraceae bacterium]|nr:FAD-binding oxidoreductase [Acetobacteraceae bacterium]
MHIVVIGGGALGLSSALHLVERGVSVTVLEAGALAGGSTGRSIGVVGTQHVTVLDVTMRAYGLRRIRAWEQHGLEFNAIGYLRLGRSESDLRLFEQSLGYQREAGIETARMLEPAEMRALVPDMSTDGIVGGLFGPDDGFLDPHQLATVLAQMVRDKGGIVRQRCQVVGADRRGTGYRLTTPDETIDCDGVVIATGAWAGRVAALFGQRLPVLPERHEAVTIRLPEPLPYVMPMVMDLVYGGGGTGLNFRHDRTGQLLTELHKSEGGAPADPDDYNEQIDDAGKEQLAELLLERLPGLSSAGFGHGWAGLYPQSTDRRPLVGPFDGEPQLIAAAGAGGYGIQLSPIIGALVADWLTDGAPTTLPETATLRPDASRLG